MGNNLSETKTAEPPNNQRDIKIKTNIHTNPEKDKGGICPICRDPKCGYIS